MRPHNFEYPNKAGLWCRADGEIVDIYPLEPVGGTLCAWGADIGITFTGAADGTEVWATDEWQGHIPANCLCMIDMGSWEYIGDFL